MPDTKTKRGVALPEQMWREYTEAAKAAGVPLATWVQRACREKITREGGMLGNTRGLPRRCLP